MVIHHQHAAPLRDCNVGPLPPGVMSHGLEAGNQRELLEGADADSDC